MLESKRAIQTAPKQEPRGLQIGRRVWIPILFVALLARLPGVVTKPIWFDEAFSALLSVKGPAAIVEATTADVHPLGYYLLLWAWGRVFGTTPFALRALSVLVGLGLVGVAYAAARAMVGPRLAAWFGWLVALSPFQVHFAQEIRMYGLLALELTAAAALYWAAVNHGGWLRWIGFAVLAAAAQYTHSLAAMYLLPMALIPVYRRNWKAVQATLLCGLGSLILYAPWLLRLATQIAGIRQAYWIPIPGPVELVRTLIIYLGGLPIATWALPIVLFSQVLVIGLGGWALLKGRRSNDPNSAIAGWSVYLAFAPLLLSFLVSQWVPVYLDRALLPAGVAFLFGLAWVLGGDQLPQRFRWTAVAAVALSFGVGLFSYWTYRGFAYAPFDEIVAHIGENKTEGEIVLHSNKLTAFPSIYYAPELTQAYLADPPGSGSDTLAPATQEVLGLTAQADAPTVIGDSDGVWFVIFRREIDDYAALGLPEHPVLAWLRNNFPDEAVTSFGDADLYHFQGRHGGSDT